MCLVTIAKFGIRVNKRMNMSRVSVVTDIGWVAIKPRGSITRIGIVDLSYPASGETMRGQKMTD